MHVRHLIELAGWLVDESDSGTVPACRPSQEWNRGATFDYWMQSRCRLERWGYAIRAFDSRLATDPESCAEAWRGACPVFEEILASEMLTRVVAALDIARQAESVRAGSTIGPRTVAIDHADMSNRVLRRLVAARGGPADVLESLHRLRRRVEYWTDRLIAAIGCAGALRGTAFDSDRATRFSDVPLTDQPSNGSGACLRGVRDALRDAFAWPQSAPTPHATSNRRIAAAVLSGWGRGPTEGPWPHAIWLEHLFTQAAEAAKWVDDALECGNRRAAAASEQVRFDGPTALRGRHVR
ncbi:MAG: hypothetical protein FJ297_12855 [Planctomycetes bacterium]|nr:hypothetical protein [Planctomycetota bacterium]